MEKKILNVAIYTYLYTYLCYSKTIKYEVFILWSNFVVDYCYCCYCCNYSDRTVGVFFTGVQIAYNGGDCKDSWYYPPSFLFNSQFIRSIRLKILIFRLFWIEICMTRILYELELAKNYAARYRGMIRIQHICMYAYIISYVTSHICIQYVIADYDFQCVQYKKM